MGHDQATDLHSPQNSFKGRNIPVTTVQKKQCSTSQRRTLCPPRSLAADERQKKLAWIVSEYTCEYLQSLLWLFPSTQVTQVNTVALCPPLVIGSRGLNISWKEGIKRKQGL